MPKKIVAKPSPSGPFFANRLHGEIPISGHTARSIYNLSTRFYELALWETISGDDPLYIAAAGAQRPILASVMGAGGEIFGVKFYENPASQQFFLDILDGSEPDISAFLAERLLLSLEYEFRGGLRPEDKAFLDAMGHPKSRSGNNPMFRSAHPGMLDWFLTEEEGLRMRAYLEAILWFAESHARSQIAAAMDTRNWPCIMRDGASYSLQFLDLPPRDPVADQPIPAQPSASLLSPLLEKLKRLPARKQGALELVAEVTPMAIGEKNERPALSRLVLIAEAGSGFVFSPDLSLASKDPTEAIWNTLTKAFLERGKLPSEVRHRSSIPGLESLLQPLGIASKLKRSLPACEYALASMRQAGIY